ncbi:NAD(P)/FAD-dependent oxidoreductase [Paenibacillus humicola]|uniref:NAD(P)/FAD-dependent oxidoreductase n=1 Tax=Paenibacillus humicola TaxID=3110540 RepID=UPI00237AF34A|nr:FAD-dependent oxidoreductase [Paenibacillus humicola]
MEELTCVIIGGGHAGLQAAKALLNVSKELQGSRRLRLILIDKQPYHVRKVLLFRPAVGEEDITIPLAKLFPDDVQVIQGTATKVDGGKKRLLVRDANGNETSMPYDLLIAAIGSTVRQPAPVQGGIALTGLESAAAIRERWRSNMRRAAGEPGGAERLRLMSAAVAGAGISGVETSAELAHAMREEAAALGLDPRAVKVYLINAHDRLFQEGPAKVGRKLERLLTDSGVTVLHRRKALQESDGRLWFESGEPLPVGLSIWALGLEPNPALRSIGLPLTPEGRVLVDACYRVHGMAGVYSIGDCAGIVDPVSGRPDGMTCKEGSMQAIRLGKIVTADLQGLPAPSHKAVMDFFCIGLGPNRGLVWTRKWGLDMIMTGKLAWNLKKWVWNHASLLQ